MQMDIYKTKQEITYINIGDLADRYGGTSATFFYITEVICGFLISPFYYTSLLNSVFKFHKNSKGSEQVKEILNAFEKLYISESNTNPKISNNVLLKTKGKSDYGDSLNFTNKEQIKEDVIQFKNNIKIELNGILSSKFM